MKNTRFYTLLALTVVMVLAMASGCTAGASPAAATPEVTAVSSNQGGDIATQTNTAVGGVPDLVINKVWLDGLMIYYTVKNVGTADSPQTYSGIYVNDLTPAMGGSSFVESLKPGEERSLAFTNYQWQFDKPLDETRARVQSDGYIKLPLSNNKVMVCADAGNLVREVIEDNNCRSTLIGIMWEQDLLRSANLARWNNNDGIILEQGTESTPAGAHFQIPNSNMEVTPMLETIPQQVPQGWMQGTFGYFYSIEEYGSPAIAAIQVPPKLHFIATVGLSPEAKSRDGITFRFGLKDLNDTVTWLSSKSMTVPGAFEDWDVDLSAYEGQKCFFLLRVDAGNSPTGDFGIWKQARLIQIND